MRIKRTFIQILLLGFTGEKKFIDKPTNNTYILQFRKLRDMWYNIHYNDFGVERLLRLSLMIFYILSPGMFIRYIFGQFGLKYMKISIDFYVILKMLLPIFLINNTSLWQNKYVVYGLILLMLETFFYLLKTIFLRNELEETVSNKRSLILVFINYIELTIDFGVIYAFLNHHIENFFSKPLHSNFEAIYFSFSTSSTVGFGDLSVVHTLGEILVVCQLTIFLIFLTIVVNTFSTKIHHYTDYSLKKKDL